VLRGFAWLVVRRGKRQDAENPEERRRARKAKHDGHAARSVQLFADARSHLRNNPRSSTSMLFSAFSLLLLCVLCVPIFSSQIAQ